MARLAAANTIKAKAVTGAVSPVGFNDVGKEDVDETALW